MTSSTLPNSAVLLLDLPVKTFVGIDLISFNSSPKFHGIINLPAGFHCLYTGADAALSIRHCHWLRLNAQPLKPQFFVLKWSRETESLTLLDPSSDASKAAVRSVASLKGRGLVDYVALQDASSDLQAQQSTQQSTQSTTDAARWSVLSRHISTQTLGRILPLPDSSSQTWTLSSISSGPDDMESIPGLSTEEAAGILSDHHATTIGLVHIDLKKTWPDESTGRDRTDKARDRSWYLEHLIDSLAPLAESGDGEKNRQIGAKELLAELQFCFLMVLTLANYSCLEQWKRILSVLFTCKAALEDVEGFFVEAVEVLRAQLERVDDVEGGLFEMADEGGSAWLRALLKTFKRNVDEVFGKDVDERSLSKELKSLQGWLTETYGWQDDSNMLKRGMVDLEDGERVELQMDELDEEEETGEYAPVVVEI